ncbi:hypothetical protein B0A52_08683 [Exophiala mesophila]|uniref:Uncharacterized protein n=1 Tax=Exophiala mesophila TaxID=212818 RepID=A0A438MYZ0_EXOME|nr:hypothetical protein B0A52_08683 [Exophiala mesophila]
MKSSPYLYIAKFLSILHPPLPKTPRASKTLVNVLESAFQKHLDEVHPSPASVSPKDSTTVPDPSHQVSHDLHRHFDSLLAHPLLATQHAVTAKSRTDTATAVIRLEQVGLSGVRGFKLVQECCRLYLRGLRKHERVPAGGQLAPRLLNWYTQMKPSDKFLFLTNHTTLSYVVPVMYKDGLESEVWNFLRTLYESSFGELKSVSELASSSEGTRSKVRSVEAEDYLISLMIRQFSMKDSLSDAAHLFIQAAQYQEARSIPFSLVLSSNCLASAILRVRHNHQLSLDVYRGVLRYFTDSHWRSSWNSACLELYDPLSPSTTSLLKQIRIPKLTERFSQHPTEQQNVYTALLDAAELSEKQDSIAATREFLNFTSSLFPDRTQPKAMDPAPSKHSKKDTTVETISDFGFARA